MDYPADKKSALKIICWLLAAVILNLPAICLSAEGDRLWDYDGVPAAATSNDQRYAVLASDGGGGAIIAWYEYGYFPDGTSKIMAQRFDAEGSPLWSVGGVEIGDSGMPPKMVADGTGGAIIAWQGVSTDIYVQKVDAGGNPVWNPGGVLVGTGGYVSAVEEDGSGGAFIVFSLTPKIVHINSIGALTAPGFDGISLVGGVLALGDPVMTRSGPSDVIVAWADGGKDIVAQKVTTGLSLPWGTAPRVVSANARKEIRPAIAGDGNGGAVIAWARHPEVGQSDAHVAAQRIDAAGSCLWTPGGVILVNSGIVGGSDYAWRTFEVSPAVAADPFGGAVIVWNDWRDESGTGGNDDVYAQRLNAAGTPLWNVNGIKLHNDPGNTSQRRPAIVSDGEYGAIVTFQDIIFNAYSIYAVGLDADGKKWNTYVYYDDPGNDQTDPVIIFDGTGPDPTGAVIAWVDERGSSDNIYAQKIEGQFITLLPDLAVESIVITPPAPGPNEAFTVDITFRNYGLVDVASLVKCGFNSGTKPFSVWQFWYLLGLEAGGTSTRQYDFPSGREADTYTLRAAIDPSMSVTESDETNNSLAVPLVISAPDTDPPVPDPMTWEIPPFQTSTTSIAMQATTADDPSLPVTYFFNFTSSPTGGSGGSDSPGWSFSTASVNGGLSVNHQYGYQVKASDGYSNETAYSIVSYEYTDIETPKGFLRGDITENAIQVGIMNSFSGLTRGDSGLFIENITAGTDSGWKRKNDPWMSSGLSPDTWHEFSAKARNGDGDETPRITSGKICTLAAIPDYASFTDVTRTAVTANWKPNGNPKDTTYFCENITAGTNSGWMAGLSWTSKGLTCNKTWSFRVKARNKEGIETEWCKLGSRATLPCPSYDGDFDTDGDVDGKDLQELANNPSLLDLAIFAGDFGSRYSK